MEGHRRGILRDDGVFGARERSGPTGATGATTRGLAALLCPTGQGLGIAVVRPGLSAAAAVFVASMGSHPENATVTSAQKTAKSSGKHSADGKRVNVHRNLLLPFLLV